MLKVQNVTKYIGHYKHFVHALTFNLSVFLSQKVLQGHQQTSISLLLLI